MILDGDDRNRQRAQRLGVDRLDRVEVDDAGGDAFLGQRVGGLERLVHGDPGRDHGHVVAVAQRAAAADLEGLVGVVEDTRRGAERAEVRDPLQVGHLLDQLRGLIRVAGMQHGRAVDRAERRDVLEPHLRRPVLADRDARV